MVSKNYQEFVNGKEVLPHQARLVGPVAPDLPIEISVYLKPRPQAQGAVPAAMPNSREQMQALRTVQHEADIRLLLEFAVDHGLAVTAVEPGRRLVKLRGPASKLQAAFGVSLNLYSLNGKQFHSHTGTPKLPADVYAVVEAVLGLDNREALQPHFVTIDEQNLRPSDVVSHLPNDVARLYQFPTAGNGSGQCIGILELGGGFLASDVNAAFAAMGLAAPAVVAVSVDGGHNTPGGPADAEVALDIQVAGGVAPGAHQAVYFAPNSFQGFVDVVSTAVHDSANRPSVLSISWGTAEEHWSAQAVQAMNSALQDAAALNVSVFVASGDNLATDGIADGKVHVDHPASNPWVFGCGGSSVNTSGGSILSETVWNDGATGTGGGISNLFPAVPAYQATAGLPHNVSSGRAGRGVPDVGADAAPLSGYRIVLNGRTTVVGGTSAVAPLWAGLTALLNQGAGRPLGFYLPALYQHPALLRPITTGNNKATGSQLGYDATMTWSACTGLGAPIGGALMDWFGCSYAPLYQQGDPGNGIGGYDLKSPADSAFAFDYDSSGKCDHLALYRPGTGTFWILKNTNGSFIPVYHQGDPGSGIGGYDLRSPSDCACAFDFDHSGKQDHIVLYRPGTGTIWILKNQNGNFTPVYNQGDPGAGIGGYDLKSPADRVFAFDYEGSGKQDYLGLYRPGTGTVWILRNVNGEFTHVYNQGDPGTGIGGYDLKSPADRIFAFDFDSSGKCDHLALYRPGTGTFWILQHNGGNFSPVYQQGDPGSGIGGYDLKSAADRAFAFDFDGSGKLDHLALYRPGTGTFWILKKDQGNFIPVYHQGDPGLGIGGYDLHSSADRAFAFDWGTGTLDKLSLYRPGTGTFWILHKK